MNLRKIAENYRSFARTDIEAWMLSEILPAIFNQVVSLEFRNDTAELLDPSRYALYTLVDFTYDASRSCEVHVLTVDDKLVGFAYRFGKDDWRGSVLDAKQWGAVAVELAAAAIARDVENLVEINLDDEFNLVKYPMHFIDADKTMFVLRSPRTVYRLNEIAARHAAYFVDEAGHAHRISSIGEFKTSGWVNGKPPQDDLVSIVVDGQEKLADATQLLFELIPGQGQLAAALSVYNNPAAWEVTNASLPGNALKVNNVFVAVRVPARWNPYKFVLSFPTSTAMDEFMATYPVGTKLAGAFDESLAISYGAKVQLAA